MADLANVLAEAFWHLDYPDLPVPMKTGSDRYRLDVTTDHVLDTLAEHPQEVMDFLVWRGVVERREMNDDWGRFWYRPVMRRG